jgi:hypothetical protein
MMTPTQQKFKTFRAGGSIIIMVKWHHNYGIKSIERYMWKFILERKHPKSKISLTMDLDGNDMRCLHF